MSIETDPHVLNDAFGIEGQLRFETRYGGPVAVLQENGVSATVALQGAQVLSYKTATCGEVLWLSPQAKLGTGKPVRGGIPVCWPWFGPHPEGGNRPAHGLVRAQTWRVAAASGEGGTELRFELSSADYPNADWPPDVSVSLTVRLSDRLTVALATRNSSPHPLRLTQALHSYFRVGDIDAVRVAGLEDAPFIDQLDPGPLKREAGRLHVASETDRIYQEQSGAIIIEDGSLARRITVAKANSTSTVVWNPWIEKSARLGDMGDEGYRRILCIETANAGGDIRMIGPGSACDLVTIISAERLDQ